MALRTYGNLRIITQKEIQMWELTNAEPHVCIRLKALFPKIPNEESKRFYFIHNQENCHELIWFMKRYPFNVSESDFDILSDGSNNFIASVNKAEQILAPDYEGKPIVLKPGYAGRSYQLQAKHLWDVQERYLLADDMGLGKTMSAILGLTSLYRLPALVVCQAHLPSQWKDEIQRFTTLTVYVISSSKPYSLPAADVYIIGYSKLTSWVDVFAGNLRIIKAVVFDECQELRRQESQKHQSAVRISESVDYCLGLSGTPIYNYGDEIYNVLNVIKPLCLGLRYDFLREWCKPIGSGKYSVVDPKALGSYLREQYLMIRRTRAEVGRELPPVNKIVHTVEHDHKMGQSAMDLAHRLAIKATTGTFMERGQASRELDALMRHATGVSKAKSVSDFVRLLLEAGQPVLLAGWHRDVYSIWKEELADHNPVFYTGEESPNQKNATKEAFVTGKSNLMIMSLRSGVGVDGLQHRCADVVYGELDWSPKVHDQFTARVDRDGNQQQVNVYYLVSEYGSDPVIIDVLGLKSMQSHGIVDPLLAVADGYSDESRLQVLAERFLNNKKS